MRRSGIWGLGSVPGLRGKAIISLPIHLSFRTSSCLCLIAVLIMMMLRIAVMRNCNQLNSSRGSPRERALCNPAPDCFGQVPLCLLKASLVQGSRSPPWGRGMGAEVLQPGRLRAARGQQPNRSTCQRASLLQLVLPTAGLLL